MYTSKKLYTPNWLKDTQNQAISTCCTISTLVKDGAWSSTLLNQLQLTLLSLRADHGVLVSQYVDRFTFKNTQCIKDTMAVRLGTLI